ncbi:MAG: hypothetical protein IIA88_11930 [Bacteroidetes bacterium]|nr:hypothetical protein [Bacteroidota bacterium]
MNLRFATSKIVNYTLACLLITSCQLGGQDISKESSSQVREDTSITEVLSIQVTPDTPQQVITDRANDAILAIKNRDMVKLSDLVHPDEGIRFSPYSHVDVINDIVIPVTRLENIFDDEIKYTWGTYAGSGEPLELNFTEYFKRFIYDQDFANAKEIGYNKIIGRGNSQNNILETYPGSIFVEYHFPGFDPKYEGMDWKSLRLVFSSKGGSRLESGEEKDSAWYLIAIIHDQWTI